MRLLLPFRPDLVMPLANRGFARGDAGLELAVARDALPADAGERRNCERGGAQRPDRAGLHAAIVKSPFADIDLAEADLDEIARRRRKLLARAHGAVELGELLLPVVDVEAHDQVGAPKRCL